MNFVQVLSETLTGLAILPVSSAMGTWTVRHVSLLCVARLIVSHCNSFLGGRGGSNAHCPTPPDFLTDKCNSVGRVNCSFCERWLHKSCLDEAERTRLDDNDFKCNRCVRKEKNSNDAIKRPLPHETPQRITRSDSGSTVIDLTSDLESDEDQSDSSEEDNAVDDETPPTTRRIVSVAVFKVCA